MSNQTPKEKFIEILTESARRRFGEERTKFLQPSIEEVARALAAIGEQPLGLEEEPGFFL